MLKKLKNKKKQQGSFCSVLQEDQRTQHDSSSTQIHVENKQQ